MCVTSRDREERCALGDLMNMLIDGEEEMQAMVTLLPQVLQREADRCVGIIAMQECRDVLGCTQLHRDD